MLRIRAGASFEFTTAQPTAAVFIIRPEASPAVDVLSERWSGHPEMPYHDYVDVYGNTCRRVTIPAGETTLEYDTLVETTNEFDPLVPDAREYTAAELPDDALLYTLPSRYCLSDILFSRAHELFGNVEPGWNRVQTIVDWVHDNIAFAYGTSTPTTTAADVLSSGTGVCRDYAHLAIAFCRAMNIPARYAFGYMPDIDVPPPYAPMDFCAWFEVFLGGRWFIFDPRNNSRRRGRVTIARGRDALDVAMVTTYGAATLRSMIVRADAVSDDERART